jgi:hypothetical protein
MTQAALKRHYSALKAGERAALYIQALDRGDDIEADRLTHAAPRELVAQMHHMQHIRGFCMLAMAFRSRQLETALAYSILNQVATDETAGSEQQIHNCIWGQFVTAWDYVEEMRAFDAFCENHGFERSALSSSGEDDLMNIVDDQMIAVAPSADDLAGIAKENGLEWPEHPDSADRRAASYEQCLAVFVGN